MGAFGTGGWVEGDGNTWDGRMGRGRWELLGQDDGWRKLETIGPGNNPT